LPLFCGSRQRRLSSVLSAGRQVARTVAPGVDALQPAADDAGLATTRSAALEFVRAVRECIRPLLRDRLLPRLVHAGDAALWLHFAEEAAAFERQLAPLRGLPDAAAADDEDAEPRPALWAAGGCLGVIIEVCRRGL
jgi:hypothetical protein